jgi:hypothetical protein
VRGISRAIYVFVLTALALIWLPTVIQVGRIPYILGFVGLLLATTASFAAAVTRLPREARPVVRRLLRARRVQAALAIAVGGVSASFAAVAFTPSRDLPQVLPIAVLTIFAARVGSSSRLRVPLAGSRALVNSPPPIRYYRSGR